MPDPRHLLKPPLPDTARSVRWSRLHGSATALAIAEAARRHGELGGDLGHGVTVVVVEDQRQLQILAGELAFFLPDLAIHEFPAWECLPFDAFSPHQDITSRRLKLLSQLPTLDRAVILTTCANLMQRLSPVDYIVGHSFALQCGQRIDLTKLREQLAHANYAAVQQVLSPGEFALRGGLVDVFPMGAEAPFRLDLLDDEIESIKYFDPDTQRSSDAVAEIAMLPAREFPMTDDGIKKFRQAFRRHFEGDPRAQKIYNDISAGNVSAGAEFFLPLFFDRTDTLFDYPRGEVLWLLPPDLEQRAKTHWAEIIDRRENANYDRDRKVLSPEHVYLSPSELAARLEKLRRVIYLPGNDQSADWHAPSAPFGELAVDPRAPSPYHALIAHLMQTDNRVLLAVESEGRREALEGVLAGHDIHVQPCADFAEFIDASGAAAMQRGICIYPLERGLVLPDLRIEVIAESRLYGEKVHVTRRQRRAQDPEAVIRSLAELNDGDPVVHVDHGVGRYRGLQFIDIDGQQHEFLVLEYQNGDKLYVPILSLHLIGRFVGGSPEHAPLHRLGGEQWQKARKRACEKAYDVAAELLEIEALRTARQGRAFVVPEESYQGFVSRFAFEETPDQQRAIGEVRADLESPQPMDRLVCGDVGFGKTEVALRAAFIAVANGCQVAILTPTTLLARQHHRTFSDRFAGLSVSVEMLSRFKTKKQAAELVARLKDGYPDIVIGTHRLLQADVDFKDLGLLIIDEEHRFGVRQKEKIKQLRSRVDLLTLTATPIPRTLNLTLSGLRAISLIATAPQLRLSIKTFIREWNRGLIREAILREIRRGGQVYFLYNEVRTMERFCEELAELVPEAEIEFAHGQMGEAQLERVMQAFYHQRFNILVCSTIIESGIDIPSANTIIIHRADRFGLAQLHQLRGRVGRSHQQAFAYLLIPGRQLISNDAKKRLDAFELMEELGAGFALASHDMEIRGAGELLGETQSGLIDEVGFALYSEYLNAAVAAIRDGRMPTSRGINQRIKNKGDDGTVIDLHIAALFPNDYLPNPHARLMFYKRIAGAADLAALEELQIEAIDRFGLLPPSGKNLFRLTAMRLRAQALGIGKIEVGEQGGVFEFIAQPAVDAAVILQLVQDQPHRYRLGGPGALTIRGDFADPETRVSEVEALVELLNASVVA